MQAASTVHGHFFPPPDVEALSVVGADVAVLSAEVMAHVREKGYVRVDTAWKSIIQNLDGPKQNMTLYLSKTGEICSSLRALSQGEPICFHFVSSWRGLQVFVRTYRIFERPRTCSCCMSSAFSSAPSQTVRNSSREEAQGRNAWEFSHLSSYADGSSRTKVV